MLRLIRRIVSLGIFVSCLSIPSFAFYPLGVLSTNGSHSLIRYNVSESGNDFIQFQAIQDQHAVLLSWEMLHDDNGAVFLVERKDGQKDFRTIGGVNARNYHSSIRSFTFEDQMPLKGEVFYRIRRESKEKLITYSHIQELSNIKAPQIQLFGSIRGEDLHFQFEVPEAGSYQISLMDLQGRKVFYEENRAAFGPSVHGRIPSNYLEKGVFLLQIVTPKRRLTERIMVR